MVILTDFVIANREDIKAIGKPLQPKNIWPTVTGWQGIESIKLSMLYCMTTGEEYTNSLQASFEWVAGDEKDGPWIYLFPKKIQKVFANINIDNCGPLANAWAKTEEMEMDGWTANDAEKFIRDINQHAIQAKEHEQSLFLWMSW